MLHPIDFSALRTRRDGSQRLAKNASLGKSSARNYQPIADVKVQQSLAGEVKAISVEARLSGNEFGLTNGRDWPFETFGRRTVVAPELA